jgi:hypothetical protein
VLCVDSAKQTVPDVFSFRIRPRCATMVVPRVWPPRLRAAAGTCGAGAKSRCACRLSSPIVRDCPLCKAGFAGMRIPEVALGPRQAGTFSTLLDVSAISKAPGPREGAGTPRRRDGNPVTYAARLP